MKFKKKSQQQKNKMTLTLNGQVTRRLLQVGTTGVPSGVLLGDLIDNESENAVLCRHVVLDTLEDLQLVLVPANSGCGLGVLAGQLDFALLFLTGEVLELVNPVVRNLST